MIVSGGATSALADSGAGTDTAVATPATATGIGGLSPADIASAYGLSGGISGGTVAVVIPYHHPSLEADLATYRSNFGLPACTSASGCLTVVGQDGTAGSVPSTTSQGWALEESLDVDAVSAACPACKVLVVETSGSGMASLGTGVNSAVALGAAAVTNSWTIPDNANASYYQNAYFTHPGVPIFAATGDAGYGTANMPASYSTVIAVGGTTLIRDATASASARARDNSTDALQVTNGDAAPATTQSDLDRDIATLAQIRSDLGTASSNSATLEAKRDASKARTANLEAQQRAADSAVAARLAALTAANADVTTAAGGLASLTAQISSLAPSSFAAAITFTSRTKTAGSAKTTLTAKTRAQAAAKSVATAKTRAYKKHHSATTRRAMAKAKTSRTKAVAAARKARITYAAAAKSLTAARVARDTAAKRLAALRASSTSAGATLAAARDTAATRSSDLEVARSASATTASQLQAARGAASSAQSDLETATARVATLQSQVTAYIAQVSADRDALTISTTPGPLQTTTPDPTPVQTTTPTPVQTLTPVQTPTPTPDPAPTQTTPAPVVTLTPEPAPTTTPTPTPVQTLTPTQTPTQTTTPMPTPTQTLTPTPDPTPTSTPTPTQTAAPAARGWTETAWSGASSGCSSRVAKPSWQTDTACSGRGVADISAVGDPNSGLAVYDSFGYGGWIVVGGTSVASPLVAAMVVRSGHAANYSDASAFYANRSAFYDITAGSNGSCGGTAVCAAGAGWDGPTGIGTPKSLSSF